MDQQQRDVVEQKGNQIVHIRGDSDSDLEALFKAVMNPSDSQVPLTVPMRLRKLPNSFFKPPETGSKTGIQPSHSRESSTDSTSAPANSPQSVEAAAVAATGLQIHHSRAHSSPASLQQTLAAGNSSPTHQQQHQHLRQQSYDVLSDDIPLPQGWEMAMTANGQRYFLNHITQTTTWEDPRKKMGLNVVGAAPGAALQTPPPPPPTNNGNAAAAAASATGPSGGNSVGANNNPTSPPNPFSPPNLGSLPDGWEQATTTEGEIYFINHQARTTSWFDPRIPMHLQRPAVLLQAQQQQQALNGSSTQQGPNSPAASAGQQTGTGNPQQLMQQRQQTVRLQRLQLERERLRLRQQEIARQFKVSGVNNNAFGQNILNHGQLPTYNNIEQQRLRQQQQEALAQEMLLRQTLNDNMATSPTNELPPVSTTGMDPFLGSNDFHSRQESADSGLGMSTNYSLPHTPEDFLNTMDDNMDPTTDGMFDMLELKSLICSTRMKDGSQSGQPQNGSEMGSMDIQTTDLPSIGDNNMDSDDLEPSLQEALSSELLDDVQALLTTNRMDNVLTWL